MLFQHPNKQWQKAMVLTGVLMVIGVVLLVQYSGQEATSQQPKAQAMEAFARATVAHDQSAPTVCVTAQGSAPNHNRLLSFGSLSIPKDGTLEGVKLTHKSGSWVFTVGIVVKTHEPGYWGYPGHKTFMMTMTDAQNKVMYPTGKTEEINGIYADHYRMNAGILPTDPTLTLRLPKYSVKKGQQVRFWQMQALVSGFEGPRVTGRVCAEVEFIYEHVSQVCVTALGSVANHNRLVSFGSLSIPRDGTLEGVKLTHTSGSWVYNVNGEWQSTHPGNWGYPGHKTFMMGMTDAQNKVMYPTGQTEHATVVGGYYMMNAGILPTDPTLTLRLPKYPVKKGQEVRFWQMQALVSSANGQFVRGKVCAHVEFIYARV